MKEALFYLQKEDNKVQCLLCPFKCLIPEGETGKCKARKNIQGKLYSLTYSRYTGTPVDPIEKKPLFHFYPNWQIMSLGSLGCNFACVFCQNWSSSQILALKNEKVINQFTIEITPKEAVALAERIKPRGNIGIAYTYNEPLINYEFVYETAQLAHKHDLKNVLVTNGFINPEPFKQLLPFIDALNVDIKSINPSFYTKYCKGLLSPVLETCKLAYKKAMLEITNLIIPTLNDTEEELEDLVNWVASELGPDVPVHFSRYHPDFNLHIPPTPVETLIKARSIAMRKLHYVYIGNLWGVKDGESTYCPQCGNIVIGREGYRLYAVSLKENNTCACCGYQINLVGSIWEGA